MRRHDRAVGEHRLQPGDARARRPVAQRAHPARVAGHEPAERSRCRARRSRRRRRARRARACACSAASVTPAPALDLERAGVDLAERRPRRVSESSDLAAARDARADHARCSRPAARSPRRARAQAAQRRGDDLRGVRRPHDGARAARQAPRPVASRSPRGRRRRSGRGRRRRSRQVRSAVEHMRHATGHEHTRPSSRSRRRRSSSAPAPRPTPAGSSSGSASTRALLVTDPGVAATGHPDRVRAAIEAEGIEVVVYDRARVEPTIDSLQEAADFALRRRASTASSPSAAARAMDTAKVADLIVTHPAPVMDYVNPPVGEGRKPPGPLDAAPGDPDHVGHRRRRRRPSRCSTSPS